MGEMLGGKRTVGAFYSEVGSQARDGPVGGLEVDKAERGGHKYAAVHTLERIGEASAAGDTDTHSEGHICRAEAALAYHTEADSCTPCLSTL